MLRLRKVRAVAVHGVEGQGFTEADARKQAISIIEGATKDARRFGMIAFGDGTILVIHGGFRAGEYSFHRAPRGDGGSTVGAPSFDSACLSAAKHAVSIASDCDGIAWTHGLNSDARNVIASIVGE